MVRFWKIWYQNLGLKGFNNQFGEGEEDNINIKIDYGLLAN